MQKATSSDRTQLLCAVCVAFLPLLLFMTFAGFLFSKAQLSGMWVSDLCGHCFSALGIPAYIAAVVLYRKSKPARELSPGWQKALTLLLLTDTVVLVINCALVIPVILSIL